MIEIDIKSELIEILRQLFEVTKLLNISKLGRNYSKDSHVDTLNRYCQIGFGIKQDEPIFLHQFVFNFSN